MLCCDQKGKERRKEEIPNMAALDLRLLRNEIQGMISVMHTETSCSTRKAEERHREGHWEDKT